MGGSTPSGSLGMRILGETGETGEGGEGNSSPKPPSITSPEAVTIVAAVAVVVEVGVVGASSLPGVSLLPYPPSSRPSNSSGVARPCELSPLKLRLRRLPPPDDAVMGTLMTPSGSRLALQTENRDSSFTLVLQANSIMLLVIFTVV